MVDCANEANGYDNMGCQGGFIDNVLDYAQDFPLLEESAYPYEMDDKYMCDYEEYSKQTGVAALSTGGVNLQPTIDNFKLALNNGPIGIAVDADK